MLLVTALLEMSPPVTSPIERAPSWMQHLRGRRSLRSQRERCSRLPRCSVSKCRWRLQRCSRLPCSRSCSSWCSWFFVVQRVSCSVRPRWPQVCGASGVGARFQRAVYLRSVAARSSCAQHCCAAHGRGARVAVHGCRELAAVSGRRRKLAAAQLAPGTLGARHGGRQVQNPNEYRTARGREGAAPDGALGGPPRAWPGAQRAPQDQTRISSCNSLKRTSSCERPTAASASIENDSTQ